MAPRLESRSDQPGLLAVGPLPPPVNGLSKAFSFVCDGLGASGWKVTIVDTADRTSRRIGSSFSWGRLRAIGAVLGRVAARIRAADVVYLTIAQSRLGFAKDAVVIAAASLIGRPVVVHMHGGNFRGFYEALTTAERLLVKQALDRLFAIIVLTDSLKADFNMTQRWRERTVAISNTCDTAPGAVRRYRSGELRILYLSTLLVSKGYREAVLAAGELARRRPHLRVTLDIAGGLLSERDFSSDEAQAADLRRRLASLPNNVTATYHGEVHGSSKNALLEAADVFVLPTNYVNEGQPIAIIEALTAGLAVVASDWRGIRETLPADMHRLLIPPRDVNATVDRLVTLVDDPLLLEMMSRAALSHAANFRPELHVEAIDRILTQVARWKRTGSGGSPGGR
jgi:glycosyltransferase involved in cell wall biosynthesis